MSERKVLNKYYPPDFDPSKLTKIKRAKDKQDNVRMMLPMSVRCNTCGNFLYIGTKFNMRKETCNDDDYLGIKIYRFYFKCSRCYAEVTMKTDPKNHDYVCEHGATRNYEPWRDIQHAENVLKAKRQLEDDDAMKNLENRTYDSKREMDILDALEEVKQMNKRLAKVNHDELLLKTLAKYEDKEEKERDQAIKESYDRQMEQLKYRRIQDDNGEYEDGDNFDKHLMNRKPKKGFLNIDNPYQLLEKLQESETQEDSDEASDSDNESEDELLSKQNETQNGLNSNGFSLLGSKLNPLKRKQPEEEFKMPFNKMPFVMKKVKQDEQDLKTIQDNKSASSDLLSKLAQYSSSDSDDDDKQ